MKTIIKELQNVEIIESMLQGAVKEFVAGYLIRKCGYIEYHNDKLGQCKKNERDESLKAIYNLLDDIVIETKQMADYIMLAINRIEHLEEKEN